MPAFKLSVAADGMHAQDSNNDDCLAEDIVRYVSQMVSFES
jgi:hypothetical protein